MDFTKTVNYLACFGLQWTPFWPQDMVTSLFYNESSEVNMEIDAIFKIGEASELNARINNIFVPVR